MCVCVCVCVRFFYAVQATQFLNLVQSGYYDEGSFYRAEQKYLLQGGGRYVAVEQCSQSVRLTKSRTPNKGWVPVQVATVPLEYKYVLCSATESARSNSDRLLIGSHMYGAAWGWREEKPQTAVHQSFTSMSWIA